MNLLETLTTYLPADRRRALLDGSDLSARSQGAALWADLSGFTPLTESLAARLGARRGAEELALYLNRIYDALIAPVDAYGGSVVGFSGDAITCWFDRDDGHRSLAAAHAMQVAIRPFALLSLSTGESVPLGIKIAVAAGPVRRLRVGDPLIQSLETLAGATVDRLAAIGHLARTGEILVDEEIGKHLTDGLRIRVWRTIKPSRERAGVLNVPSAGVEPAPPQVQAAGLREEQLRPWLLPAVYARLQAGQGEFLTELRPAAALFMRFEGLDYEGDEAVGAKLDAVIRQVQAILAEYDGSLLQLTIGDKGSYLYAAFGAPVAHEDDTVRAVAAALELCRLPVASVGIGLSHGLMRTGAYGGATRRTYGVLGDEVNLAARLMERSSPGQVLASAAVWESTAGEFEWKRLPALKVKGRRSTVRPALLVGRRAVGPVFRPPAQAMVGRQAELALALEKFELARQGRGQVLSITGEAGMGKSRLLSEIVRHMDRPGQYTGECQSYGTHSSYLVWQSIWRSFFGIDASVAAGQQFERLRAALAGIDPLFSERLPLLGSALNLNIPDNSLTSGMDPRLRKAGREALLVDCLRARARQGLQVLILEDVHWIDPLSRDLLEIIVRVIRDLPVLVLLTYRSPVADETGGFLPVFAKMDNASQVKLGEMSPAEAGDLIAARLSHFKLEGGLPGQLIERLVARTQGNPFYIEEFLNYLHDRALDPRDERAWDNADLPDSLQSLILSRIDQLTEAQQITLKAASIIGRLFRVAWLSGYYPPLGGRERVSLELELLDRLELVARDAPEPQLAYLFKHIITQEVAYESLAYATRASLHEQFARYLEEGAGEDVRPYLDLLAFHYERSGNLAKKREYLRRAGEAARAAFANTAALSYFGRALALAPENDHAERYALLIEREQTLNILGRREEQEKDLAQLAALAELLDDDARRAQVAVSRARFARATNDYPATIASAQRAVELAHAAGTQEHEARAFWLWGEALFFQGIYADARTRYEQALAVAQQAKLTGLTANILTGFGTMDTTLSRYDSAHTFLARALDLHRQAGDRIGENLVLSSMGDSAFLRGDFAGAQFYYEETLHSWRSIGHKQNEGRTLSRLASQIIQQASDFDKARLYSLQALPLAVEAGDRTGEMVAHYNLSDIDLAGNNYLPARREAEQALHICREITYRYYEGGCLTQLGTIADELGEHDLALKYHEQGVAVLTEIGERDLMCQIVTAGAIVHYHRAEYERALEHNERALAIVRETKSNVVQLRASTLHGHILCELSRLDEASSYYHEAWKLALETGMPPYAKQAQAGLAWIALERGNSEDARRSMDELLEYLKTPTSGTRDELIWLYLVCYRILKASSDPRADATLETAHTLILQIAARIEDTALRRSFLEKVRFNRETLQAWEQRKTS